MIWLIILLTIYTLILGAIIIINHQKPVFDIKQCSAEKNFSIIIPFKNEEVNLPALISSIKKLSYPNNKYEVIFVNDHSTDQSEKLVKKNKNINYLINQGHGKKAALKTGINKAQYEYIVTIDADCIIPSEYLQKMNCYINKTGNKMILGPVKYIDRPDFLGQFQQIEFLSLQAFTMATTFVKKPFLANGANLVFEKKKFNKVRGYNGNEHIASGDDVFLLQKFKEQYPKKIGFLKSKEVLIQTKAQKTWHDLFQQKIRWAGKSKDQSQKMALLLSFVILGINSGLIYSYLMFPEYLWFIIGKLLIESFLIYQTNKFYKTKIRLIHFLGSFIIYPFYFYGILFFALKGTYTWKGKTYK